MLSVKHIADPAPQLDVLYTNGLHRSATFRTCLEKAVDDINDKYGNSASACLPDRQIGGSSDDEPETSTNSTSHLARTNFQPRYRLPRLVQIPPLRSEPAASELEQVLPQSSNERGRPGRDGSPSPDRHEHETVEQAFKPTKPSTEAFVGEQTNCYQKSDYTHSKVSSSSRLSSSLSSTTSEKSCPGARNNAAPNLRRLARRLEDHHAASGRARCPPPFIVDAIPGTFSEDFDGEVPNSDSSIGDAHFGDTHGPQPQNLPPKDEASSRAAVVALKRVRSIPKSSEACSEAELPPLHRPRTYDDKHAAAPASQQRAPSVSELVSKFRQMESPPSYILRASIAGNADFHVMSAKAGILGTSRSNFSDDSEDTSALASNAEDAEQHPVFDTPSEERIVAGTWESENASNT